jgi:hypothetical protein
MSEQNQISVCPFLKAYWDETIRFGYPNKLNYCHKAQTPQPVSMAFQERVCLSAQDRLCPIYAQSTWPGELPWPIREEAPPPNHRWMIAAIALILLVFGFGTAYFLVPQQPILPGSSRILNVQNLPGGVTPSSTPSRIPAVKIAFVVSATHGVPARAATATPLPPTATGTTTATATRTATATLTLTLTPTPTTTPTRTKPVLILIPTEGSASHPGTAPTHPVVPTHAPATAVPPPPEEFPTSAPTDVPPPPPPPSPPPPPDDLPTPAPF